jgi:dTDP-4-dehydrorhamnose 3,5-epimerase-like enzyme
VTFSNDNFPRSQSKPIRFLKTRVCRGASVGAGAVVLPGIQVGEGAMIGAGSVVTRDVPARSVVFGNPARFVRFLDVHSHTSEQVSAATVAEGGVYCFETSLRDVKVWKTGSYVDRRGVLTAGDVSRTVPFEIQRYFSISDVPEGFVRGNHSHRRCHQFMVCLSGSCSILLDDGVSREVFHLDSPEISIYVPPGIWGAQFDFSSGATLQVFASEQYDRNDYIDDYREFLDSLRR